ncbi:MAG: hypothetical protein J6B03_11675 [Candidatus Homeothermus sp.]|nr:hypothetical protein [Candidatus Homeothermus sp.]
MVHPPKRGYITANQLIFSINPPSRSYMGCWKGNVTNLRILPWKGKMGVTAGSSGGAPVEGDAPHNNATLKRVA